MAYGDMSTLSDLLKIVYAAALTQEINQENIFLDRMKRISPPLDASGDYFRLTNIKAWSQGVGARRSRYPEGTVSQSYSDAPPEAGYTRTFTPKVRPTALMGRIQLDDFLLDSTRNQQGAVADAMELEMESLKLAFANMVNCDLHGGPSMNIRQCRLTGTTDPDFGDGVGGFIGSFLGASAITSSGVDITFLEPLGTDWLQEGMLIELWDVETPGSARFTNSNLLSVSAVKSHTVATLISSSTTVSPSSNVTYGVARRDGIYRISANLESCSAPYGSATVRILPKGLVSLPWAVGTDIPFQGIDPASNRLWQSQVSHNSGVNRALTLDLMASVDRLVRKAGGETSFLLGSYEIQQKYYLMLFSLVRFVNTLKLDGGYKREGWSGLDYFGKPLIADAWAYPNHLYWIDERDWAWAEMNQPGWLRRDGQVLRYSEGASGTSFPSWYAVWRWYVQLYLKSRRKQGVLADIEEF